MRNAFTLCILYIIYSALYTKTVAGYPATVSVVYKAYYLSVFTLGYFSLMYLLNTFVAKLIVLRCVLELNVLSELYE